MLEQLVERHDQALPALALPLPWLNDYAVPYRYDEPPPGFEVDAAALRQTADGLRVHVGTDVCGRWRLTVGAQATTGRALQSHPKPEVIGRINDCLPAL